MIKLDPLCLVRALLNLLLILVVLPHLLDEVVLVDPMELWLLLLVLQLEGCWGCDGGLSGGWDWGWNWLVFSLLVEFQDSNKCSSRSAPNATSKQNPMLKDKDYPLMIFCQLLKSNFQLINPTDTKNCPKINRGTLFLLSIWSSPVNHLTCEND